MMDSMMAGLCCGKGDAHVGNPMEGDLKVVSGESGAAAFGLAAEILMCPGFVYMRNALKPNWDSVLLFISTEGATDRENYKRVLWG